ncbi:MAG: hypothetical protein ACYTE8_00345, partial [Planctomycetota bacterium]|jgi:L-ribulose-5-phosphate 3-epimerase UlaE
MSELTFTVVTHFAEDDEDCGGDYMTMDIRYGDRIIAGYDDYYHDHSDDKVDGFIEGVRWALANKDELAGKTKIKTKYVDVADSEY